MRARNALYSAIERSACAHGESQDGDSDLRRAAGEALVEQPDAQDDAGERVGDDQNRLGHAQRPDMKSGLLKQRAGDGSGAASS